MTLTVANMKCFETSTNQIIDSDLWQTVMGSEMIVSVSIFGKLCAFTKETPFRYY